jgi:pyruvate/2-oxoglutarate dehydrogenase complex dihydrolipoamide dehydrogenase (E3) component
MDIDVAVLGGGPGGYTAAIRAAQIEVTKGAQPGGGGNQTPRCCCVKKCSASDV